MFSFLMLKEKKIFRMRINQCVSESRAREMSFAGVEYKLPKIQ